MKRFKAHINTIKTNLALLSFIVLIAVFRLVDPSKATFQDLETTSHLFTTGSLDLEVEHLTPMNPTSLNKGDTASFSGLVSSVGSLDFRYSQKYATASGDLDLCQALHIKVIYNWYDSVGTLHQSQKYNGLLEGFSINQLGADSEMQISNSNLYFSNPDYLENQHWYSYELSLPTSASDTLIDKSCHFSVTLKAWQKDLPLGTGFGDEESFDQTITTGDWTPQYMTLGFESQESLDDLNDGNPWLGFCHVVTADQSDNHNQSSNQILKWTEVIGADKYQVKAYHKVSSSWMPYGSVYTLTLAQVGISNNVVSYDAFATAEEETAYYIQALNSSNQVLATTYPTSDNFTCTFTVDRSPSGIVIYNSPGREVENRVVNGDFSEGLFGWTTTGQIKVVTDEIGSQVMQLGTDGITNTMTDNSLSQEIDNSGHGLRSIGFWYKLFTYEDSKGFDQPSLKVSIDEKVVYELSNQEVFDATQLNMSTLYQSQWQYLSIDLSQVQAEKFVLAISAGNSGDQHNSSWYYLDDVSTNVAIVNSKSKIEVLSDFPGILTHYFYLVNGQEVIGEGMDRVVFQLNQQPDDGWIQYWSDYSQESQPIFQKFKVIFDDQPPEPINGLEVIDEGEGEYQLAFSAPKDNLANKVSSYDIRYSTASISAQTNWEELPIVNITKFTDLLSFTQMGGLKEEIVVAGLEQGNHYFFAIKSKDSATNISSISNVAEINSPKLTQVKLNEIYSNAPGDDSSHMPNGEWVEINNFDDSQVDLNGWYLTDQVGHKMMISLSNIFDTDLVIGPGEKMVIYSNQGAIFNNTGDQVSLFDGFDNLVDSYLYDQSSLESQSLAKFDNDWLLAVPTPGTENALELSQLQPTVVLSSSGENYLKFALIDAQYFDTADYSVLYSRFDEESGQQLLDALKGQLTLNHQSSQVKEGIYLGTCSSSEGLVCTPHLNVTDISIEVLLKNKLGEELVVFADIN